MRLKNNSVSFQCIADIVPSQAINFLWKRNGSFIDTSINDRVILTNDGRFTIKRIRLEDFNSYQCVAQFGNSAVISQSANLERECKSFKLKSRQQSWATSTQHCIGGKRGWIIKIVKFTLFQNDLSVIVDHCSLSTTSISKQIRTYFALEIISTCSYYSKVSVQL